MFQLLTTVCAVALLCGCAHAPTAAGLELPPLAGPAAFALPAVQTLEIALGSREERLQCALVNAEQGFQSICVNPLGMRVFTLGLGHDGTVTAERGPGVPEALDARRVLADVQLAGWPLAALEAAYAGSRWRVTQPTPDTRRQWLDDELVSEVHYAGTDARARHWLVNLRQRYTLGIRPEAAAP